jgi:PAS domain S-box-containing protein
MQKDRSMTDALRLFLIEDDDDIALLIRRSLERAGHEVTRCRTAADAVIVLSQNTFDLVLLDQLLPDMAGLDLLGTLAHEGIAAPVLMVTAHGDEHLAAKVFQAGALDYIVKDAGLSFLNDLPKRVNESVNRYRLEQTNALLIQALESARDGIMITDLQGVILKVNQALVNMTGYSRQELEGQTPRLLKSQAHPPEFYAGMWTTVLGRNSWQGEVTNRRKDGSHVPTSMTISPIVDPQGRLTHFVGIQRDVTEHKQLERQLLQAQKMQSVGTLAGGVAHEFNNLLAGINGYAALGLREPDLHPTVREFLQHVVSLSERAAILTRQLLAFARKPALSRQRTAIPELLRSTAELVTRTLHVEVVLEVDDLARDGAAMLVEADANQLQQALVNLALNARDAVRERAATGAGTAAEAVTFRARNVVLAGERFGFPQHVPPGDYVVLEVEDQGCGMSPEVLNQALDPFFTTKGVGQGTGLGLPMVFGIVQGHQGFLTIETRRGRGTCIRLFLPRLRGTTARRQPAAHRAEVVEPERGPGRMILVIDDEQPVLDVVRRFLQIAGHQVICATSAQEGLDHLTADCTADLVVLDLMMPREDARTSFERLRQRRPGVPVLLCTGLPEADPTPELLRRPGVGLIRKPFRMNELWYAVNQALSHGDGLGS